MLRSLSLYISTCMCCWINIAIGQKNCENPSQLVELENKLSEGKNTIIFNEGKYKT